MIEEIDIETLASALESGTVLIDVRMPDEFEEQRVPGAVLIPLPELPDRFGEISSDATTYVICRSGARSMKACEFLDAKGYTVCNVTGGTMAWVDSGRPTDSGA